MKKSCPEKEGHPTAESTEKILDPFARANSARTYSDYLTLNKFTQLGELKCLYGETLDQLGRWPYHHKRVNRRLRGWVTLLAKPTFFHIYKVRHFF